MKNFLYLILLAALVFTASQFVRRHNRTALREGIRVSIEVWDVPPRSLPRQRQLWDETVRRFEELNPDVRVVGVERQYSPEEFITVMAGGKGPDVVKVWAGNIQTLASLGFLAPLDDYTAGWSQKDFVKPVLWESVGLQGRTYGVPADTYFLFLLYRKDLFSKAGLDPERPPANWDELVAYGKALTDRSRGRYGVGLVPKTWYFQDFVWQAGGEMVRVDDQGRARSAFQEPPAVQALRFWKDLRWKHDILQPNLLTREDELLHLFALGKVAMIFGVGNDLPPLLVRYRMDPSTVGIAPLPAGPAGRAAHLGGQVYVMNVTSPKDRKDAAWRFIEFELSPANQLWKWNRMNELGMPVFPGAFSSTTEVANLPEFSMVQDALATARIEPHVKGWPQVRALLDQEPLQAVLLDPGEDPATLLLAHAMKADREIFGSR
jgi:ABC-type glycerol-3-phosphate transport system substrate-binding protein